MKTWGRRHTTHAGLYQSVHHKSTFSSCSDCSGLLQRSTILVPNLVTSTTIYNILIYFIMISQHFPPSYTSIYREFLSFSLHPLPFRETPQVLPGAFTNSGSNLTEMSTKSKAGGQFAKASSSGHPKYMTQK